MEDLEIKENAQDTKIDTSETQDSKVDDSNAGKEEGSSKEQSKINIEELNSYADELGLGAYKELFNDNPEKFQKFLVAREREILSSGKIKSQQKDGHTIADEHTDAKQDDSVLSSIAKFDFKFKDPDDVNPELLKNLNDFRDHTVKQIETLFNQLKPLSGLGEQFNSLMTSNADALFENSLGRLPSEYFEFVGKGGIDEISEDQFNTRSSIFDTKEALRKGYLAQGLKVPSEYKLVEKATKMVLEEKKINLEKKKIISQAETREKNLSLPPSSRKSEGNLTPEERAAKLFDARKAKITGGSDD